MGTRYQLQLPQKTCAFDEEWPYYRSTSWFLILILFRMGWGKNFTDFYATFH